MASSGGRGESCAGPGSGEAVEAIAKKPSACAGGATSPLLPGRRARFSFATPALVISLNRASSKSFTLNFW